jgi:hypothetical protein
MIFARFEKRGPAGRERDDFPTSLRCRRLAVGMGRSDLAEFLEVPITAVRNWERGKSRPADSQAVLDRLTKIQENLERAYLDTDENGGRMLWVEENDYYPLPISGEEAGARLFFYMPRTQWEYERLMCAPISEKLPLCSYRVLIARLAARYDARIINLPDDWVGWRVKFERLFLYLKKEF